MSGFSPTPNLGGRAGRCPHIESQEPAELPQGAWARVTLGPERPSWRDLTPKVRGHSQGRAGRHRGVRGSALMVAPERRGRGKG